MKESEELGHTVTFGVRIMSDLLPKYSKREHVRPLNEATRT